MEVINVSASSEYTVQVKPKLMLLKCVTLATIIILLCGIIINLVQKPVKVGKADDNEVIMPGDGRQNLTKPQPQSEPSSEPKIVINKKPQQTLIVEEGSDAYYCIKNNGGSSCLGRDKIVQDYKVVNREKTYEDRLVEYGINRNINPINNNCPPEISWQPNCQY